MSSPFRILFLVAAAVAVAGPAAVDAAVRRTQTGPIDRQLIQDDDFCSSTEFQGTFDGDIEVTIEFRVRNLGTILPDGAPNPAEGGNFVWMFHAIDAVSIVTQFIYDQNVEENPICFDPCGDGEYLRWDLVPFEDFAYLETFGQGLPFEWDQSNGAYENQSNNAEERTSSNDLTQDMNCVGERSGGSLGLGQFANPNEFVSTHVTIPGLTPGDPYVLSYWWHAHADSSQTNGDLWVDVWGEEPWEDRTPAALVSDRTTWSAAWGDYDGDGDPDLYLARGVGAVPGNRLLKNNGGVFVDATPPILADTGDASGATWADVDGDGDQDLYLANWDAAGNRMWRNDGGGDFADVTTPPLDPGTGSIAPTWVDYDLDGDVDLFLVRATGSNHLVRNDGNFQFTDVTSGDLVGGTNSSGASWADYDLDGDPDVYVCHAGAPNQLLRNDGGTFTDVATGALANLADAGVALGCAWADFDNDGDFDLFVANDFGENRLFENNGSGTMFANIESGILKDASEAKGASWTDYDLDGDLDLFLSRNGSANSLFRNDGGNQWVEAVGGPFSFTAHETSLGGVFGDADGDGDPDLVLTNSGASEDAYFRNDGGTGNHWLAVDLKGNPSNASGLGARIELEAGGVRQTRYVSSGSSYYSQNHVRALFGLGGETTIQDLVVHWPSGIVQSVTPPSVDQRIVIVESDATDVPQLPDARPARLTLALPAPNPFGEFTTLVYELPRRSSVQLRILDVAGRRVRTFDVGPQEPGTHELRWDGRNAAGDPIPGGVYFVRLEAAGEVRTRKLLHLGR